MVKENQNNFNENNELHEPLDTEIFNEGFADDNAINRPEPTLSEKDVFAGDRDFYNRLTNSANSRPIKTRKKQHFNTIQKVMVGSIVVIIALLLYGLAKSNFKITKSEKISAKPESSNTEIPSQKTSPLLKSTQKTSTKSQTQQAGLQKKPPLSLKVANSLYDQKDYQNAYLAFETLAQKLPEGKEENLIKDFFKLKMAFCLQESGKTKNAVNIFTPLLESDSPLVKLIANYQYSIYQLQQKQFSIAGTAAYQTIALIKLTNLSQDWAQNVQHHAYFIAAQAITRKVLTLSDTDKNLPPDLWETKPIKHPINNLDEQKIRSITQAGIMQLRKVALTPQIQNLKNEYAAQNNSNSAQKQNSPSQWSINCYGASFEELIARFAANEKADINWNPNDKQKIKTETPLWADTPINLYMPATTSRQFVNVASGCAGLIAHIQIDGNTKNIYIYNPKQYSSLKQHIDLLSLHAIRLWQTFIRNCYDDQKIPNAHFALALLNSQQNNISQAAAEYKLVANRFSRSSLAPFALFNAGVLKSKIKDYNGSRKDLTQLVQQYPQSPIYIQAYLKLADNTLNAQLYNDAVELYQKVYYLDSPPDVKANAAFKAAQCFYKTNDYQNTIKWLNRYGQFGNDQTDRSYFYASYLLGKSYMQLENNQKAALAFKNAMGKKLTKNEYAECISALVNTKIQQEELIEALDIIEGISSWQITEDDYIELIIKKAKILRSMGLLNKALLTLGDKDTYLVNQQLKAKIALERANIALAQNDPNLAYDNLVETITYIEPGPLAQEITCKLADISLKIAKYQQSLLFCRQLLKSKPDTDLKDKALYIMAKAHRSQKDYNQAALCLLGKWAKPESINENIKQQSQIPENKPAENTQ